MISVSWLASSTRRLAPSRRPRPVPTSSRPSSDTLAPAVQALPGRHRAPGAFGTTNNSRKSPETGRILDSTSRPQPTHPHPITGRRQINEAGVGAPPNAGKPAAVLDRLRHSPQPVAPGRPFRSGFMVEPAAVALSPLVPSRSLGPRLTVWAQSEVTSLCPPRWLLAGWPSLTEHSVAGAHLCTHLPTQS